MAGPLALLPLLPLLAAATSVHAGPRVPAPQAAPPISGVPLRSPPPVPLQAQAPWVEADASGRRVRVNGLPQDALWQAEGGELWLPLELLEGQLGVSRREGENGALVLEWYGRQLTVPANRRRSLADEVAVPSAALLRPLGVTARMRGSELMLNLPSRPLLGIRSRDLGTAGRRVVFDLEGPGLLRSGEGRLLLGVEANVDQRRQLERLGLAPQQQGPWLSLRAEGQRLSLGEPWRLVLDLPAIDRGGGGEASGTAAWPPERDPRLARLMAQGLTIDRRVATVGPQRVLIHSVRLDPGRVPLELRPLSRPDGMQGLSSLGDLARREQALIAVNGGYFNRVNRLPLGALRDDGVWLSGPILNRGAIGWQAGGLPSFGRLRLEETIGDRQGRRLPVDSLNSGYVQKGVARYTVAWGRSYRPISGDEMGLLLRSGVVMRRFESGDLAGGVPLAPGDDLLVARGGLQLAWQPGERLELRSRASHSLGIRDHVIGGGPLLLLDGRIVLNGAAEGFSPAFLSQGAPRTVIASDGRQLWLMTLQGVGDAGPTLLDTARLLQSQGLKDALNLDGGSSTGLVLGDTHTVRGRGVAAAVHNGLGLVPRATSTGSAPPRDRAGDLAVGP